MGAPPDDRHIVTETPSMPGEVIPTLDLEAPAPEGEAAAGPGAPGGDGSEHAAREQTTGAISRSVVLVGSRTATWGLAFIMTVMMPRYLGATEFGRLYLAISLTGIMTILVEFGLNSLVTREVSRQRDHASRYLVNAGAIKFVLWIVGCLVLAVGMRIAGYPPDTQIATMVLAVSVLFTAEASLAVAVLQANDRMRWIALSTMAEKLTYVTLGVLALLAGYGILAMATVMLIGTAAGFLLDLWWLRVLARDTEMHAGWQGIEVRSLFVRALPFFSVLFFGAIYFRIDVVILSLLRTDAEVGFYGAAYRLFQTTYILPEAFLFSLFPLFCRLSPRGGDGLAHAAQKGLEVLVLIGLPLATAMVVLSEKIITTLYGAEYAASVPLLRMLSIAVAFMYANGVFVQLLIATERQKKLAVTAGAAAALNLSVNFMLIPMLGALGAATATVLTEAFVIVLNFSFLSRELTRQLRFEVPLKAAGASIAMAAVLVALGSQSLVLLVPAGIAAYVLALVVLRAITPEDWRMIKTALANVGSA